MIKYFLYLYYSMCITKDLYDEFISAIRWLKKNQMTDIKKMTPLEKIIFFNLWIISYYVFYFTEHDKYKMNNFIDFIDNIEHYDPDKIYRNLDDYRHEIYGYEKYELCLKLLHKNKFDYDYLCIVEKCLSVPRYLDDGLRIDSLLPTLVK